MNSPILHAAQAWHTAGFSLIRAHTDGTKRPHGREWTTYQQRTSTAEEITTWFAGGHPGMGIVCGAVSGGAEMLELEGRAVNEGLYEQMVKLLDDAGLADLWTYIDNSYSERTPSGGYHWIYRIGDADVPGNTKLARRPATPEELAADPDNKIKVLAETRGEGGFVIVAPSNGTTHETGQPWTTIHGHPGSVAIISLDERNQIHQVVRCLDQMPQPAAQAEPVRTRTTPVGDSELSPGDDFEQRTTWAQILTPHGWAFVARHGHTSYWRRPGKDRGISATTGHANDRDRLYVFTTSTQFEPEHPYTRFGAYALLEHGGDHSAAARELARRGYGTRRESTARTAPRPTTPTDDSDSDHEPDTAPAATDANPDDLWTARPVLAHLHTYARARRACPWAVLGVTLVRVVVAVKPYVVLPALIGGHASLNLFVGIVADSGGGKGAAEATAEAAINLGHIDTWNVGSGEGIAHLFMSRKTIRGQGRVLQQHADAVLMSAAEIDTVTALADRQGSTILAELRKAWMGETLGFAYADPDKRLPVKAHTYRLGLVTGIQPARAGRLLGDTDGGTPQRFLWLPAADPDAPDQAPPAPERLGWRVPRLPQAEHGTQRAILPVCDQARNTIDAARVARLRGQGDALDGHALLNRLKTAAALALLDSRAEVTDDDWHLAGIVQAVSDRTRTRIVDDLARATADRNRRRGEAEAERAIVVTERIDDHAVKRVARTITRKLADGPMGQADLRRALTSRDRPYYEAALDRLREAGQIEAEDTARTAEGHGGLGTRYRLVGGAR